MNSYVLASLGTGVVFGLSAGLSPGPLLALVISHTLRHGVKEGVKVSFAPLVTDSPIILLSVLILVKLSNADNFLGVISLLGGSFVLYLAYESLRSKSIDPNLHESAPKSLAKGAIVNFLSPYPYLFWMTVGAPFMIKAWDNNTLAGIVFVAGFYIFLVVSKMTVAIVTGKSKQLLQGRVYVFIMRLLGIVLLYFALLLFKDGLNSLGFIIRLPIF
jgi:threonine/homoserine/homoserine lactone efflux protein